MSGTILNREESFHDEWAHSVNPASVKVDELETACTLPETRYIIKRLGKERLKGRKILEIGCGCGEASVYFAKHGAEVYATDLSPGMVELAKKVAAYHHTKIHGCVCAAEKLPFADHSFDIVYAANVLHHADMDQALDEIRRVLKKNGVFIAWDPIAYNPAINVYRLLASGVRTEDEHPVTRSYVESIRKRFDSVSSKGFWFLTNIVFVKYYFVDRLDPSKVRYWKRIIDDCKQLESLYLPLEKVDQKLLKRFPFLKWMCWNMVIIAKNRGKQNV